MTGIDKVEAPGRKQVKESRNGGRILLSRKFVSPFAARPMMAIRARFSSGYYVLEDGQVVLTNEDRKPLENTKPAAVNDPARMRRRQAGALRDRRAGASGDFDRRLVYPKKGGAA